MFGGLKTAPTPPILGAFLAHKTVLKCANSRLKYGSQIFPKNRIFFLNSTIHPKLETFHTHHFLYTIMANYKIGININPNGYNSVGIYEDCPDLAESSIHTAGLPQSDSLEELKDILKRRLKDALWCAENGVLMVYA